MRILMFSNYFPPYARGGYEQWCAEVAVELHQRGHEVHIVTGFEPDQGSSTHQGLPVHRVLHLEAQEGTWETARRFFFRRKELEKETLRQVRGLVDQVSPDVAFVWGMWNVPRSVLVLIESLLPKRVVYYFCDYWPTLSSAYQQYWSTPSGRSVTKALKNIVGRFALKQLAKEPAPTLQWQTCLCVSSFVCQDLVRSGIQMGRTKIVYGGTQVEQFKTANTRWVGRNQDTLLRLLYAGRIDPDKGVHTIVQALGKVPQATATLTICGNDKSSYGRRLRASVQEQGLSERVTFMGSIPRSEMPAVMAQHDVLVFASIWEEPFARTVIEGMAAGLAAIGTTTGGTGEILVENETGLTFPAGDDQALASQIIRLSSDPDLLRRLSNEGRQLVNKHFRFDQMVDAFEWEMASLF
jgi:glycosyltransferase involved in cell wall biosynthesis